MKCKKFLLMFLLLIIFLMPVYAKEDKFTIVSGDINTVGSEICFDTECFYVIENNGNTVMMLAKMNITLDDDPKQSKNAGITVFSSDEKKGDNYSDYDGSIVKVYVDNYMIKLKNKNIRLNDARLISFNELTNLGCDVDYYECNNATDFVYSTSYWTNMIATSSVIWGVNINSHVDTYEYHYMFGVRPVIEVPIGYFDEDGAVYLSSVNENKVSEGVISNDDSSVDLIFNDLGQDAKYEVIIHNDTDKVMYVNYLDVENLSENFIDVELDKKSENMMIEPNGSSKVSFFVKTKAEEGAGRNLDDEVILKFRVSDKIYNPNTFSDLFDLMLLIIVLGGTIYFVRKNKHKKTKALIIIGIVSLLGINYVNAEDFINLEVKGKIKYISQNNIISTGTILNGKQADYTNSKEVWAYYDKVKNVEIKSLINEPKDYYKKFDLTENRTGRVMAYLIENNDKETPYDLVIMSQGVIIANSDSSFLFSFPKTEKVEGLKNIDFSETISMQGMFLGNEKVENLEIKEIPLDKVTDTSYMFYDNKNLDITIKDFDTEHIENIENITYMTENYLYDIVKHNAKPDENMDYKTDTSSGNYLFSSSKNTEQPIYYYRNDVKDNNVKFAGFCWYIVRTTETGGIKLLYNGTPDENGNCIEKNQNSYIAETKYSYKSDSLQSIGYMNGGNVPLYSKQINLATSNYIYGNSISYDYENKKYILEDTYQMDDWTTDWNNVLKNYQYTCFNETGTCDNAKRLASYPASPKEELLYVGYVELTEGRNFEEMIKYSQNNINNSTAKDKTDEWYVNNLINYTEYLEDTIWCNDRSFINGPLGNEKFNDKSLYNSYTKDSYRIKYASESKITFECEQNDSFTVSEENGNGALTYPIGLLTLDELYVMGSEIKSSDRYFVNKKYCMWLMTPERIAGSTGYMWRFCNPSEYNNQMYYTNTASSQTGVTSLTTIRPAISLKSSIRFIDGTGISSNPYVIE